jgi:hypothetical protein
MVVSERSDAGGSASPACLIVVEQSGAKHELPQRSRGAGMAGALRAMRCPERHLREVKVVIRHRAIARWKASEQGWRRVI